LRLIRPRESIGEKPKVANPHESFGENVQKESLLELESGQRHYDGGGEEVISHPPLLCKWFSAA
jgi:hypothetical protein